MTSRQSVWSIGGVLLIVAGIVAALTPNYVGGPGLIYSVISTAVFALAMLILTFGTGSDSSIVGRRPFATAMLTLFAIWPLVRLIVIDEIAAPTTTTPTTDFSILIAVEAAVSFALSLIAAVVVSRSPTLPVRVRRAPIYMFGVAVAATLLLFIMQALLGEVARATFDLIALSAVVRGVLGTAGIGIVALIAAVLADEIEAPG